MIPILGFTEPNAERPQITTTQNPSEPTQPAETEASQSQSKEKETLLDQFEEFVDGRLWILNTFITVYAALDLGLMAWRRLK